MKRKSNFMCILLVVCILFCTASCARTESGSVSEQPIIQETELGEGKTQFLLTVADADENEYTYSINTDKKTVGEALLELEYISGEEGPYGLYIKTVNGITADFNDGGKYWAFYIDGEYATSGVDTTEIKDGATYALKIQK